MTFISVARFYLENVLCQSLGTFTVDLVTLVNSHQHQFAQCLTDLWRIEHPLPQKFRGCDDLGASWDSVAIIKMKRNQQISKLQDDHFQEHQLCVIFWSPSVDLSVAQMFKKPFWPAELDAGPHFPARIWSWGLSEPHLPRDFLFLKLLQFIRSDLEIACSST